MSTFKAMLLAGAVALTPLAAHAAAPKEAPVAEVVADDAVPVSPPMTSEAALADAKAKMQVEMDKAIAMVEKLFGTKISWEPLLSCRAAKRKPPDSGPSSSGDALGPPASVLP